MSVCVCSMYVCVYACMYVCMYVFFWFFLVNILFISMYISGTISLLFVISQSCSTSRNKKTKQVQLAFMLVFNLLG